MLAQLLAVFPAWPFPASSSHGTGRIGGNLQARQAQDQATLRRQCKELFLFMDSATRFLKVEQNKVNVSPV